MIPSLEAELLTGLFSLFFGVLLGLFYDGMRVVRILLGIRDGGGLPRFVMSLRLPYIKMNKAVGAPRRIVRSALLFLCDVTYALLSGIGFSIFLYAYHDGVFRLFLLAAAALGMAFYFLTLGQLVSRVTGTIAYFTRILLSYLFLSVRTPLLFALRLLLFSCRMALAFALSFLARLLSPLATKRASSAAQRHTRAFFFGATRPT